MTLMEQLTKLKAAGFEPGQAEALLDVLEQQTVTRDYLDGKLNELLAKTLLGGAAIAGLSLTIAKAIGA